MTDPARKRRRFSLSIGMMMLLILVLGIFLGRQATLARRQVAAVAAVKARGGWVHYDYEFVGDKLTPGRDLWVPGFIRRALGDEYFQEIRHVSFVYDDLTGTRHDNIDRRECRDALELLASQTGVRTILMREGQATDRGLASLRSLTGLEDLYIWDSTELTDAGVANLKDLVNLRNFHLEKSKITDDGLRHLAGLTRMEKLALEGHAFSNEGFSALTGMKGLKSLSVAATKRRPSAITDEGLRAIADHAGMEVLDLSHSRVGDEGLKIIAGMKNLNILYLDGCGGVTDEGLASLADLVNLKWLLLDGTRVSDEGLVHLGGMQKLRLLRLPSTVSKEAVESLKATMPANMIVDGGAK